MTNATAKKPGKPKRKAAYTKEQIQAAVPHPLPVKVGDTVVGYATFKEFATKSYGMYMGGKAMIPLEGGVVGEFQIGMNITLIGSKPE